MKINMKFQRQNHNL